MWTESHQTLARHPKTLRAARLCGASVPALIGHLHLLWWWCLDYAPDGDLGSFTPDDLEYAMGWEGTAGVLFDALRESGGANSNGFIESDADGTRIHDWQEYGGKLLLRRKESTMRMARNRVRACSTNMRERSQNNLVEERRGEEITGEEITGEGEEGADAPPAPQPLSRAFPEGFVLRDADLGWAEEHDFSDRAVEDETWKFVDYYRSRGDPRTDWYAAWRNWMRRINRKR